MSHSGPTVFLRTTAQSDPSQPAGVRFQACVRNTGNYFFEQALLRHLDQFEIAHSLETLPPRIGRLILSMSNFLSSTTDLGYVADALSQVRVEQVVMIGAGAQAYEFEDRICLSEGTRRFLHFVAERSVTIGVRGCYTADILARLGVHNVEVIGCPAAFWSDAVPPGLDRDLPPRPRLAVNATPLGHFRDKVSALLRHGILHGADYVMQSEAWLLPILDGAMDDPALVEDLLYYAYPECNVEALTRWLTHQLRVFFGVAEWIDHMGRYDFVYGSRFHGNMAAIQAGVPALSLPFDTRTRELCEYLNLPYLPLIRFRSDMPVAELRAQADFSFFERTYPLKRQVYIDFLDRNGLAHALARAPLRNKLPAGRPSVAAASLGQLLRDLEQVAGTDADALAQIARRLWADRCEECRLAAEDGRLAEVHP